MEGEGASETAAQGEVTVRDRRALPRSCRQSSAGGAKTCLSLL